MYEREINNQSINQTPDRHQTLHVSSCVKILEDYEELIFWLSDVCYANVPRGNLITLFISI